MFVSVVYLIIVQNYSPFFLGFALILYETCFGFVVNRVYFAFLDIGTGHMTDFGIEL